MLRKGNIVSPQTIIGGVANLARSAKKTLRVIPNFKVEADYYDIKLAREVIGNCTFTVSNGKTLNPKAISEFPDTWLTSSLKEPIKPFLNIRYIELIKERGQGLARKAMQIMYEISCKRGCEGRIALKASPKTRGFYSHLGFDCPPKCQVMYDKLYEIVTRIADSKNLKKREFAKELRAMGCPTKTNGKYNTSDLRFFIPTPENLALLFKK